ncbi:sugar phosphate isomerase/epimerase [bacterium]|nr:sugar phosphate isomerase/epimerase [bacterium]
MSNFLNSALKEPCIAGVEIYYPYEELETLLASTSSDGAPALPAALSFLPAEITQEIFRLSHNSIHLAALYNLPREKDRWMARTLNEISAHLNICEFTIHPDDTLTERWKGILEELRPEISLSVENMDKNKNNFQSLEEFEALFDEVPNLKMTFDICHWLELGHSESSSELLSFLERHSSRISKVHFSVPSTTSPNYGEGELAECSHFLAHDSGHSISPSFFGAFSKDSYWVLEGLIPLNTPSSLLDEMRYLLKCV